MAKKVKDAVAKFVYGAKANPSPKIKSLTPKAKSSKKKR